MFSLVIQYILSLSYKKIEGLELPPYKINLLLDFLICSNLETLKHFSIFSSVFIDFKQSFINHFYIQVRYRKDSNRMQAHPIDVIIFQYRNLQEDCHAMFGLVT